VCWLRATGQGEFEPHRQYLTRGAGEDVKLGDVTGDGKPDAVSVGAAYANILVNQVQVPTPTSFCFGDATSTACPCNQTSSSGSGCPNSAWPGGARLAASGVASVSTDSFTLTGTSLPNGPGLMFQGTSPMDAPFNDGKVCAGGTIVRIGIVFAQASTSRIPNAASPTPVGLVGGLPPIGGQRYYQLLYRDSASGFCTSLLHNMTNGVAVAWIP
jgi:hypothetical protein